MRLTAAEVDYLAAWGREEQQADCYRRPAHRLQLSHGVRGAHLIDLIKVWTTAENKPDCALLEAASNPEPAWPWGSTDEFWARLRDTQAAESGTANGGGSAVREK